MITLQIFIKHYKSLKFVFIVTILFAMPAIAQDLDPRAYARVPVNLTAITAGFSYVYGGVVTDVTAPVQNIKATIENLPIGVAHTFSLFKQTAQIQVAVPYSWAQVSGDVGGQAKSVTRTGFSDMRLRFSYLLLGGGAASVAELRNAPRKTILGVSINTILPTGQFYTDKLINLGTNRFSLRPEIAISQPLLNRWLIDVYAGVWFFTDNKSFYPGNSIRSQQPMGTIQAHISYNINPLLWVALNATYYVGGKSSINDVYNDDRQSNSRIGATAAIPLSKRMALKFAYSRGAVVRIGQNFDSFSVGLIMSWIKKDSKTDTIQPK